MNALLSPKVPLRCGECNHEMVYGNATIWCNNQSCGNKALSYEMPSIKLVPTKFNAPATAANPSPNQINVCHGDKPAHFIVCDQEGRSYDVTLMQEQLLDLEKLSDQKTDELLVKYKELAAARAEAAQLRQERDELDAMLDEIHKTVMSIQRKEPS